MNGIQRKRGWIFGCIVFGALLLTAAVAASPAWPDRLVLLRPFSTVLRAARIKGTILAARLVWLSAGYGLFGFLAGMAMRPGKRLPVSGKALLCTAGVALLLYGLQCLLWRSVYCDDLLSALSGGCAGAWLALLIGDPGAGRRQKGLGRVLRTAGVAVFLAALIGAAALDLCMPAGLVRYNETLLPVNAVFTDSSVFPAGTAKRYWREVTNLQAGRTQLTAALGAGRILMEETTSRGNLELMTEEGMLWIDTDDTWCYSMGRPPDARDAGYSTEDRKTVAAATAQRFLRADETLVFSGIDWTTHEADGVPQPCFCFCADTDRTDRYYLRNEIRVVIVNGMADWIYYNVVSGIAAGEIDTVSAQSAYAYATQFCAEEAARFAPGDEWSVQRVEPVYLDVRDWLLPAYRITAWRTTETGDTETVTTTMDAVRRF